MTAVPDLMPICGLTLWKVQTGSLGSCFIIVEILPFLPTSHLLFVSDNGFGVSDACFCLSCKLYSVVFAKCLPSLVVLVICDRECWSRVFFTTEFRLRSLLCFAFLVLVRNLNSWLLNNWHVCEIKFRRCSSFVEIFFLKSTLTHFLGYSAVV